MLGFTHLWFWRLLAILALALGAIGLVLPVLPTVPFLIVAAWAAGKSSPRLEHWLLTHPACGPHIRAWRARRVIPRRAKWLATLVMTFSAVSMQFTALPLWLRIGAPLAMATVGAWLWRHPDT